MCKRRTVTKSLKWAALLLAFAFTMTGCSQAAPQDSAAAVTAAAENIEPPAKVYAVLAVVGDIMVHADQLSSAYEKELGSYDFRGFFSEVEPYLKSADLTIGNLETTTAGPEHRFSGYPRFNTPRELISGLQDAGFDFLTTSNNHSMDRNEAGVLQTLENLDAAGMLHTGTFASPEERSRVRLMTVKGIKTAVLSYTYGTNGIPVPQGKEYLVNLLDLKQIQGDIAGARQEGAELVLVYPHIGIEYRRLPGDAEKSIVDEIFKAGADIVTASHPHVLQPMEDRSAGGAGMFAAYSLGNFISGQRGRYKDSGVILFLTVEKDPVTDRVTLADAEYIPTWVHKYKENGRTKFRVLAVEKAIRDYAQGTDKRLTAGDNKRLQEVWQETTAQLDGMNSPRIRNI